MDVNVDSHGEKPQTIVALQTMTLEHVDSMVRNEYEIVYNLAISKVRKSDRCCNYKTGWNRCASSSIFIIED